MAPATRAVDVRATPGILRPEDEASGLRNFEPVVFQETSGHPAGSDGAMLDRAAAELNVGPPLAGQEGHEGVVHLGVGGPASAPLAPSRGP